MQNASDNLTPALPHISILGEDDAKLIGSKCNGCGTVFVGTKSVCPKCGDRKNMVSHTLGTTGKIHTYTIVSRSFPGVKTPFVSAIVALDGGGSVHATIEDIDISHDRPLFGLPVKIEFAKTNQKNDQGQTYLAYHFVPASYTRGASQ